ncbi:MAG: hypothetical protein ACYTHK_13985 [Planctomycetota bacterium]|jgi:hypothetical protein
MNQIATQASLEVQFANFLDGWRAEWRYEPRWPSAETGWDDDSPEFRVWLPMLHAARWRLARAFYVRVGTPVLTMNDRPRDLPCYTVTPWEEDGELAGFLFYDPDGRVSLRAPWRAN